jgi:hypothetical protein
MVNIAIVCEGKNDKEFLETLISHIGFDKSKANFYIFGGKSKFFELANTKYKDLKLEIDSGQIEKVLFVLDADDATTDIVYGGFENTQKELNVVINQLGIENISHAYVMCDPTTKIGYLESFILSTIPEGQRNCIKNFLECSQFKSKENHKAILNQIYNIAYPKAPYNFEHHHFEPLKTQLTHLFK